MARFQELGAGSFFGSVVWDEVVPSKRFLRQLDRAVDWKMLTRQLLRLYKGQDAGARQGVKGTRRWQNAQEVVEERKVLLGYREHVSLNAEAEMTTSVVVTAGGARWQAVAEAGLEMLATPEYQAGQRER